MREFVQTAFTCIGKEIEWVGQGVDEKGIDAQTGAVLVCIDPVYFRPTEVDLLVGDATKAEKDLGWKPKTTFQELVKLMVEHDVKSIEKKLARTLPIKESVEGCQF